VTTTQLHQLYLWLIGLLLAVGGYFWWRHDVGQKAIVAYVTHSTDSTIKVKQKALDSASQKAQQDSVTRERALSAAKAQIVRQRADSARADSLIKVSANERERAERLLRDSLASAADLRNELGRAIAQSRADSGASVAQHIADALTIRSLMVVISADSTALASSHAELRATQALADLRLREIGLLKAQAPSKVGNILKYAGWGLAGFGLAKVVK
jgi:hypothetical protein